MSNKNIIIILSAVLGTTLILSISALIVFYISSSTYATQLENVYKRSFYELSTNINDIEVDMSKLIAVNEVSSKRTVLNNIYTSCQLANINISNLPISSEKTIEVNNFINVTGGYVYSLLEKVYNNTDFSELDYEQIELLYDQTLIMAAEYNNYISTLNFDYLILNDVDYGSGSSSGYDGGFNNSTSSEIPTLIYDGPFSDSVTNKEIVGLSSEMITQEQAELIIAEQLDSLNITNIKYINMAYGNFTTYNFSVTTASSLLYVQVTEMGGQILEITGYGTGGVENLTDEESIQLAQNFARQLNYNNVHSVWFTSNDNVMYVNLAPIIDGVIYYSDLVKVKVDKTLGEVVALEGQNYCYNNTERTLSAPQLTFDQAQENLSQALTVTERNLALIPNEFVGETLTYEFICTWRDYTYYIYIDVETGAEVNILRVINTSAGQLII